MASFVAASERYAQFVARTTAGAAVGFAEASVRSDYVNGTAGSPVAFLEGLYVTPECRRHGYAKALVSAVAAWAQSHGLAEVASDASIANHLSHAVNRALGFAETERVVFFRKAVPHDAQPPLHPTCVTWLRQLTQADELQRRAAENVLLK